MADQSSSFDAVQSSDREAIRILLVEDDQDYADVLIAELAERGVNVRHAPTVPVRYHR